MNRITGEPEPQKLPEFVHCPHCNGRLELTRPLFTSNNWEDSAARPGDISLCYKCATPSVFDENMNMVKLGADKMLDMMKDPGVKRAISMLKAIHGNSIEDLRKNAYYKQLDKMRDQVKAWLATSKKQPAIQYNFTEETAVIAALDDAIKNHFISVNDDALSMFKELGWLADVKRMPTVFMVRMVMENL